jgi:hypothetical protein
MSSEPTDRSVPGTMAIANWRSPAHIRWALRNFGALPGVHVPRAGRIHALPAAPRHDVESFRYDWQGESTTLLDSMSAERTDGYLVIKDDQIVYERYFDAFRETDHHLWASATKSLVSSAFGVLAQSHGINEDKTLPTTCPSWPAVSLPK